MQGGAKEVTTEGKVQWTGQPLALRLLPQLFLQNQNSGGGWGGE